MPSLLKTKDFTTKKLNVRKERERGRNHTAYGHRHEGQEAEPTILVLSMDSYEP